MKIRKFEGGGNTRSDDPSKNQYVDTDDIEYKAIGLKASNAELERGERKQSGFLGLGRLFQGDIDQKGSEAYNLYGAGYGREVEARNDRLKAATLKKAADDEARNAEDARNAKAAASEDDPEKKFFGAGANNRPSAAELAAASAQRARDAARGAAGSGSTSTGSGSTGSGSTTPEKGDKGARDTSSFKKSTGSGSAPVKAAAPAASTGSAPASVKAAAPAASTGTANARTGQTYDQVDAEKQKGFTASPMSKDPSQRAKAAAAPAPAAAAAKPAAVKPLSQAQQNAQAVIARATGNSSGSISNRPVPTPAEAARNIAEAAKKAGDTASSFVDNFKIETIADRRSRLAKEAKAKETASFNRERGDRATGGVIKSYAKGGSVSASSRGDGIAQRGKTRGRMF